MSTAREAAAKALQIPSPVTETSEPSAQGALAPMVDAAGPGPRDAVPRPLDIAREHRVFVNRNLRLDKIMVDALKKIWDTADRHKVTLRTATFAVACERILIAREERGLYP